MPKSDREVFDYLRADTRTAIEIDFLAYALYTFEKFQWSEQLEEHLGRPANVAETERWISDVTPIRFGNMREEAARLFDNAARRYLAGDIEAEKQEAVRTSILGAVKAASAFWKQLAVALITAILAPLIIGAVIVSALTYDHLMPNAAGLAQELGNMGASTQKSPALQKEPY